MNTNFTYKKILVHGVVSGFFFVILWSGWAYYMNLPVGKDAAIRAAITQGSFTIVNAFVYTVFMEYMFSIGNNAWSRLLLAFVLPNLLVTTILFSIHTLRGTPNLLQTIVPVLLVVYSLSLLYVLVIGSGRLMRGMADKDAAI